MIIYLDIETLPSSDGSVVSVKPPATMKKAETIAKWEEEEKPQAIKEALHKTGLDGLFGRVCCVSLAVGDDEPVSEYGDDEKAILVRLNDAIESSKQIFSNCHIAESITFCGHNLAAFDLPFLKHRYIINRVKPHPALLKAMQSKPWDSCIADTMLMWSSDSQKRVSMDKLCKAFGIEGKGDFDGSMVAETWPTDPMKVVRYCEDDVRRTREIYKRLTWA